MTTDFQSLDLLRDGESLKIISSVDKSRNELFDATEDSVASQLIDATVQYANMGAWQDAYLEITRHSAFDCSDEVLSRIEAFATEDDETVLLERLRNLAVRLQAAPLREIMPLYLASQCMFGDICFFVVIDADNRKFWLHDGKRIELDDTGNNYSQRLIKPQEEPLVAELIRRVRVCNRHITGKQAHALAAHIATVVTYDAPIRCFMIDNGTVMYCDTQEDGNVFAFMKALYEAAMFHVLEVMDNQTLTTRECVDLLS